MRHYNLSFRRHLSGFNSPYLSHLPCSTPLPLSFFGHKDNKLGVVNKKKKENECKKEIVR